MIYKTDSGHFVISSGGTWLPGSFESKRAANYGFRFSCDSLKKLQDIANDRLNGSGGTITFKDLQKAALKVLA